MEPLDATLDRVRRLVADQERVRTNSPAGTAGRTTEERAWEVERILLRRLPAEYAGARPDQVPALRGVHAHHPGWGVCFRGPTGIGKTYAACALAYRVLCEYGGRLNRSPDRYLQFERSDYLFIRIADTFGPAATETRRAIIDELVRATVLVLDDVGAEKTSEFTASTLCTIIAKRRDERRVTLVTTNQTLAEIDAWEPRIASRLAEMAEVDLGRRDRRLHPPAATAEPPRRRASTEYPVKLSVMDD